VDHQADRHPPPAAVTQPLIVDALLPPGTVSSMDRISDAYYVVVDFASEHKVWAGSVAAAFVLVIVLLAIALTS